MDDVAAKVATAALSVYDKLPPSGKPRDDEYTVLAAVVAVDVSGGVTVVSLGTGTKCVGREFDTSGGCFLSDSHAETIARRAFMRYLYHEICRLLQHPEEPSLLQKEPNTPPSNNPIFQLDPQSKLFMYISDSPCGDAAMYETNLSGIATIVTGAKPVEGRSDTVGCLCTKSGRGDIAPELRTTSMSCSDKVCRWCYLGLQG
jgi:tRNA-specific adenosine deaminase 1